MRERALSRADIETLLDALSERLHETQAFAKLHLVGSACIALAYERERTTLDIDARVDAGHSALEDAIREIAQEHDLPERWLNDQARGFIPEADDASSPTLYESQSLVVTGASGEYLLAMKLEASREKDTEAPAPPWNRGDRRGAGAAPDAVPELEKDPPGARDARKARRRRCARTADAHRGAAKTVATGAGGRHLPSLRGRADVPGIHLTVQPEENADRKVLGKGLSLYTLALEERTHRGWPHEATDIIMEFTEAELARRIVPAYREGP